MKGCRAFDISIEGVELENVCLCRTIRDCDLQGQQQDSRLIFFSGTCRAYKTVFGGYNGGE